MYYIHFSPKEKYEPIHRYEYHLPCVFCGEVHIIPIPASALYQLNKGALIQSALPLMRDEIREMLISGICPKCWVESFPEED